jgi:ribonucleoside-diphosphate reductase beta chain
MSAETEFELGLGRELVAAHHESTEAADRAERQATSVDLYNRWERQQWRVADLDMAHDAAIWAKLRPFYRNDLLTALAELEIGEVTVTKTLSSLVDHAPTDDDRIYLCTQLADEGRHVKFFDRYFAEVIGVDPASLTENTDYEQVFAPQLERETSLVRTPDGGIESWYRALVYYHLVTEGVLAAAAMPNTRAVAKRLSLSTLDAGLVNVIRDESRHISFGVISARQGVANGFGELILDAYLTGVRYAAMVAVGPRTEQPLPAMRIALVGRAAQLRTTLDAARERVVRQPRFIGLAEHAEHAGQVWDAACENAMDEYAQRWGKPHPIRAAA